MKSKTVITLMLQIIFISAFSQDFTLVKDIFSGTESSDIENMFVYNEKLYFTASDATFDNELWVYDGISDPVSLNINPSGSLGGNSFIIFKDKIYCNGMYNSKNQLLEINGDNVNIIEVSSSLSASISNLFVFNDQLVFSAIGNNGKELWTYDGISSLQEFDLNVGNSSSSPRLFTILGDKLCFQADFGNGYELWIYDGINSPVKHEINSSNVPGIYGSMKTYDSKLYFAVINNALSTPVYDMYSFDENNSFTPLNLNPQGSFYPYYFSVFNNKLIFNGSKSDSSGNNNTKKIWEFDGINLQEVYSFTNNSSSISSYTEMNSKLYFYEDTYGENLVAYDGSNATNEIEVIPGSTSSFSPFNGMISYNNHLIFSADAGNGMELWSYNETNNFVEYDINLGTDSFAGISVGPQLSSDPKNYIEFNNKLYFVADQQNIGKELFSLDISTSTHLDENDLFNEHSISIYPNPVTNFINIDLDLNINSAEIYTLQGMLIKRLKLNNSLESSFPVNGISPGIYQLLITTSSDKKESVLFIKN